MESINGFPMIIKMNEQFNMHAVGTGSRKFTEVLKDVYKPLNNTETSYGFLSEEILKKELGVSKYMVMNIINRFQFLNTILSLIPDDLYSMFLSSNEFRAQLITKGACVKLINGNYISYSYKQYTFPTTELDLDSEVDINDLHSLGKATSNVFDEGSTVLNWPGCSLVLPKEYNIFTLVNPEITFPNFIVKNRQENNVISFYEENWGVSIMQSKKGMIASSIEGGERAKEGYLHKSFSNQREEANGELPEFFNISFFLDKNIFSDEDYELTLELPLSTPRQDILMKITDEEDKLTPIIFTITS